MRFLDILVRNRQRGLPLPLKSLDLNFQLLATEWQIQFLIYIALRGIPPLQGFPSFKLSLKIHPFGALLRQGISPSAEGDQGSAFGFRKPLKRLDLNFRFLDILVRNRQRGLPSLGKGLTRTFNFSCYFAKKRKLIKKLK
jgi:hypothetical protein